MCVSCGCGALEDSHGDERNITLTKLHAAAEAAQITMPELAKNLQQGLTLRSPGTDKLTADIESMKEPLPGGLFPGKLESTQYPE